VGFAYYILIANSRHLKLLKHFWNIFSFFLSNKRFYLFLNFSIAKNIFILSTDNGVYHALRYSHTLHRSSITFFFQDEGQWSWNLLLGKTLLQQRHVYIFSGIPSLTFMHVPVKLVCPFPEP